MLAYVFWHWKAAGVAAGDYENRQRAFHAALAAEPPPGFHGSVMKYGEFFARVAPEVEQAQGALWMRQMVLGPAREFCLHAAAPASLPAVFGALVIPLRQAWPGPADKRMEPAR